MFGLMRAKKCGMSADERHFRRLNYCGTCKTIGSVYGQKARLMLNHDMVFLAEILTSLRDENTFDWERSYQSFNCLNLPKSALPVSLQFAAAANVILAEFKIADHINDSGGKRFKLAHRIFSNEFLVAEKSLREWNFPLEQVREILQTQEKLEAESSSLDILAEPTAATTALFFAHGVELIGKPEYKNPAAEIGYNFGKLIYLLDAFEDFERDAKTNQFNAIRSAFALTNDRLPKAVYRKVSAILRELESKISTALCKLPINERQKQIFVSRLRENLDKKLKSGLPVLKSRKINLPKQGQKMSEKYQSAIKTARALARNYSWEMPLVFLFVFVFAFVAPAHSREAKSARECFDLSFNLMFLGAVFGSATISVKQLFIAGPETPLTRKGKKARGKKATGGSSSSGCCCCCDWDDGCDCCCDCGCDSCDCCDCGDC